MEFYPHPDNPSKMITEKEYFNIMFGEEFMNSTDKGTIKQYEDE
jgi:hypothetical protein